MSVDVARFVTYALLGSDHDGSACTQTGERVARLAVSGIRLVIDEFRTDVIKTLKDGSRGRLRIDYGDPREPQRPIAWLWKFVDGGKSAGEILGRVIVVLAAEQYASRLVLPTSQRTPPIRWSSHKDISAKALKKLASRHLPASLKAARDRGQARAPRVRDRRAGRPRPAPRPRDPPASRRRRRCRRRARRRRARAQRAAGRDRGGR
jgi:hypothetical protein